MPAPITLFVSTRKGLWTLRTEDRVHFHVSGPHHLGCIVHHTVLDPRDGRTLLAAAKTGSQWPEKIDGICKASGFSLNVTA